MALLRRKLRGPPASAHKRSSRRKGAAPARKTGTPAADKYGPSRLEALYEIGKLLTPFVEAQEQTVLALLTVITKELPLRSAILIEKTTGQPKAFGWHAPDIGAAALQAAETRAMKSFTLLSGFAAPAIDVIVANKSDSTPQPAGDFASNPAQQGKFITCPLIIQGYPIFGVLHVEGGAPFDETDVAFLSAIANQLAISLDRYQGRLHEIALRKQADELNAFKTNLVSIVSHEFANALAIIKSVTFLLKEKLPPDWRKENDRLFDMMNSNIEGLIQAVQNLLNMGRLEAGKLAINVKATDAGEILKSVLQRMELLCEKKSLQASLELPPDLQMVRADQASLTLVISNLLSNAIKYTPENGRVVLGIVPENSRPGYYRLYVQDTGIGVSEEDRGKILGGHYRSESGKKMTTKGFGVGLSLARQIVEAHDSTIEIEGAPGKGSRFSFLLPISSTGG
jgi:signal transduction histidine kinase